MDCACNNIISRTAEAVMQRCVSKANQTTVTYSLVAITYCYTVNCQLHTSLHVSVIIIIVA